MDIYGYNSYQYSQSDEIAKQMFAQQQQGLSSAPYNRDVPAEAHIMPAPSGAPWDIRGITWGTQSPPQLVQFTGQPTYAVSPVIHCKRKSLDVETVVPAKQLITEDKMAAHLNGLHISSEYTPHTCASEELMDVSVDPLNISEKLKGHTIVLSEEVKKIKDEPLLPASLIERLEKPSMSLVVWKPRENIVEKIIKEEDEDQKADIKTPKRRGLLVAECAEIADVEM